MIALSAAALALVIGTGITLSVPTVLIGGPIWKVKEYHQNMKKFEKNPTHLTKSFKDQFLMTSKQIPSYRKEDIYNTVDNNISDLKFV